MSEPTARPDKPRIVVYESDACQGNLLGWTCDDCKDGDCEHECHDTEHNDDLSDVTAVIVNALHGWHNPNCADCGKRALEVLDALAAHDYRIVKEKTRA